MNKTHLLATIGLLGSLATSQAAFTLLDDFESYTTGTISGQSANWSYDTSAGLNDASVGSASGNNYLIQGGANNSHTKFDNSTVLIPDEAIGTYFFRAFMPANTHVGTGISPLTAAGATNHWNDGKAIIRFGTNTTNATIYGYDLPGYAALTDGTPNPQSVTGAWYNVWLLIDNTTGNRNYDVHVQSDDDANYATQTQVGTALDFRQGTGDGALQSLFFRTAINATDVYFDDLYIDSTSHNLVNPIPEPATALLGAFGILGLLRRRR